MSILWRSGMSGIATSGAEGMNNSKHGSWLLVRCRGRSCASGIAEP